MRKVHSIMPTFQKVTFKPHLMFQFRLTHQGNIKQKGSAERAAVYQSF